IPLGLCAPGTRTAAGPTCGDIGGEQNVTTAMMNLIIEVMPESRVRPFFGAGVGAAWAKLSAGGQLATVAPGARAYQDLAIDDKERVFAWQGIIGLAFDLSEKLTLDLTGRYL